MNVKSGLSFVILAISILSSCSSSTPEPLLFDKQKWQEKDGEVYLYREQMLDDVIDTLLKKGVSGNQIMERYGKPDREQDFHLYYTISKTKAKAFTLNQKSMVIQLKPDSMINWVKIHGGS